MALLFRVFTAYLALMGAMFQVALAQKLESASAARSVRSSSCDPWDAAVEPIYLWGIQRDCQIEPQFNRDIATELALAYGKKVQILPIGPAELASACTGQDCVDLLRQSRGCEGLFSQGTLIGGALQSTRIATGETLQIRLWRADLQSREAWEYVVDARGCHDGVCGDGRHADQEIRRLRPSQLAAGLVGRLAHARVDHEFQSCQPGCSQAQARGASVCLPARPQTCGDASALGSLPARPDEPVPATWRRPSLTGKIALAVGAGVSAVTTIALASLLATRIEQDTVCSMPMGPGCNSQRVLYQGGLWLAGGATALFGAGLAAVFVVEGGERARYSAYSETAPSSIATAGGRSACRYLLP